MNNLNDLLNNKNSNNNPKSKDLNYYMNSKHAVSKPFQMLGATDPIDYGRDVGSKHATRYLPGRFSFLSEHDPNELQAHLQPWATKAFSGAGRAIVKAGVEVAKMPGVLGGLVAATAGQIQDWATGEDNTDFMQVAFNNDWINNVEQWGKDVNENILPVYVRKAVREGNLWDNITSIDFWSTDGADGLGFILSMLVPGLAITKLGAGVKASKLLSKIGTPNSVLKSTGFVGKGADLRTATFTNTLFEAGVESNHFMQETEKELTRRNQLDPNDPEYISDEIFEQKMSEISKYAAGVLGANAAILLGPNWIMSKMVYGGSGTSRFGKKLYDKQGNLVDNVSAPGLFTKERWKRSGQRYGKAAISEGFWEEGMQDTSSGFLKDRLLDDSDKGFIESYFDHIATTEGQKAIFLGAVFGGMMYSSGGRKADVREAKKINDLITTVKDTFKGVSDYTDIEIYKTKDVELTNSKGEKIVTKTLDLDANGEPQLNPDGVLQRAEILGNMLINGKLYQQAVEENDIETIEEFHDKALHKLVEGLALRGENALEVIDAFVENSPEIQELINKQEDPARGKIDITSKLRKKVEETIKANEEFQNFGDLIDVNHSKAESRHYEGFRAMLNKNYLQIRNSLNYYKEQSAKTNKSFQEYLSDNSIDPSVFEGDNQLKKNELLLDERLAKLYRDKNVAESKLQNYKQQEKDFWNNKKQQEEFNSRMENQLKLEKELERVAELDQKVKDIDDSTTLEELNEKITKEDLENPKIKELYDTKKQVIKEFEEATKQKEKEAQKDAQENDELNEEESSQEDTSTKKQPVKSQTNPEPGNITQTEGSELHDETIPNGTEGNTETLNKEKSPLFKRPKLITWNRMQNKFFDWINDTWQSFERNPKKKDGTPVTFQINTKYGRTKNAVNWDKAVAIYNNKVVKGKSLTQEEISILEDHLPINTHIEGKNNLFAPIETRPDSNLKEGVRNFNENTKPLRKRIITELIKNKSFDGIQGSIFKQFPGVLKVADKIDGKIPENNISELDAVKKGLVNIFENIRVVLKEGVLQKPDRSTNTMINVDGVPVQGVGELYLMIPRADGSMFPLKLNIQKVSAEQADVLADIYGFALEAGTYKKQMKVSELPKDLQTKIGKQLKTELSVIKKGLNKTSKDITVGDLIDILIWDNTKNKKTKIGLSGTGVKGQVALTFGQNKVLDLKGENRDKFIQWITETKRRNISFVGQVKNGVKGLSVNDKVYLDYLIDNKVLNTNAVVNEPTFQGYTNIYLSEDITNTNEVSIKETVSDSEYNNFVDKGIVTEFLLESIVNKIKNNQSLSPRETAIFNDKTSEINELLKQQPQQSELQSKKADIERRRQEEINKPLEAVKNAKTKEDLIKAFEEWIGVNPYDDGAVSMGVRSLLMTPGSFEKGKQALIEESKKTAEIRNKQINAKYDAELAALEQQPTQSNIESEKTKIEKRRNNDLKKAENNPPNSKNLTGDSPKEAISNFTNYLVETLNWKWFPIGYKNPNLLLEINKGEDILAPASILSLGGGNQNILDLNIQDIINAKYDAELAALEQQPTQSNLKPLSETGPFDPKIDTPGNKGLYPVNIDGTSYFASPASGKVYRSDKYNIDLAKERVEPHLVEHVQDNELIQRIQDDINSDELYTMMGEPQIELNKYEEKTPQKIRKSQEKVVPLHKDPTTKESEQVNEAKEMNSNKLSKLTAEQTRLIISDLKDQGYFRNKKVMNVLSDKNLKGVEQLKKLQEIVNEIKKNAFDEILDKHCK